MRFKWLSRSSVCAFLIFILMTFGKNECIAQNMLHSLVYPENPGRPGSDSLVQFLTQIKSAKNIVLERQNKLLHYTVDGEKFLSSVIVLPDGLYMPPRIFIRLENKHNNQSLYIGVSIVKEDNRREPQLDRLTPVMEEEEMSKWLKLETDAINVHNMTEAAKAQMQPAQDEERQRLSDSLVKAQTPMMDSVRAASSAYAANYAKHYGDSLAKLAELQTKIAKQQVEEYKATRKTDNYAQQNKSKRTNSSLQSVKGIITTVMGITTEQKQSFHTYLEQEKKYSVEEAYPITNGAVFLIHTSMSTAALIKIIKAWNTHLHFTVNKEVEHLIMMTATANDINEDKPNNSTAKKNVVEQQKGEVDENITDDDLIYEKPPVEATFPGGEAAFESYLQKNLNIDIPKKNGAPPGTYTVVLHFIVSKKGSISNIEASNKTGYGMDAEAVRVIKSGPNWVPAQAVGYVRSFVYAPVKFIVK